MLSEASLLQGIYIRIFNSGIFPNFPPDGDQTFDMKFTGPKWLSAHEPSETRGVPCS